MKAATSKAVYHSEIKGDKENSQDGIILAAIRKLEPCSARQIQKATGLEINIISRSINNLWTRIDDKGNTKIEKAFEDHCKITNRKVKHYRITVPKIEPSGQIKLF